MSGGGSQPVQTTSSSSLATGTPWAPAAPYLEQGMQEAAKLYAAGPQKYTPFSQVSGFTPEQLAAQRGIQNYATGQGTQDYISGIQNATYNQMQGGYNPYAQNVGGAQSQLAGRLGDQGLQSNADLLNQMAYGETGNPYLDTAVQGSLQQMSNAFLTNTLPGMRRQAIGEGTYGSSRNALAEGQALGGLEAQMQQAAQQGYMGDYNTQEQNRLAALGQIAQQQQEQTQGSIGLLGNYANQYLQNVGQGLGGYSQALSMPLGQLSALYQTGADQQIQAQKELDDATARWKNAQNQGWENLSNYAALINPMANYGTATSKASQTSQFAPPTSTAGNIVGGLLSMAPMAMAAFGGGAGAAAGSGAIGSGTSGWASPSSMGFGSMGNAASPTMGASNFGGSIGSSGWGNLSSFGFGGG